MEHPFLMFLNHTQRRSTVGRTPLDELITRPEESYRLCCVVVCDLETSRMGAPYIYNISRLRVNSRNSGCLWSLFSNRISIIRIFFISGSFSVRLNMSKCSSTVLYLQPKFLFLLCDSAVKPHLIWRDKWRFSLNILQNYKHETIRFLTSTVLNWLDQF